MKKSYYLISAGLWAVLMVPSFSTINKSNMEMVVGQEPYLPETPYNYCIQVPEYLVNEVFWVSQNEQYLSSCISDDKATLGRVLFYDKRLSSDYTRACASCHQQEFGFADNQQFSSGVFGQQTTRNVPSINDLVWSVTYNPLHTPLFWDGRTDNLGEMVLLPISHPAELGLEMDELIGRLADEQFYRILFKNAFGDGAVTSERISAALKQFILPMVSFDSKFDSVHEGEATFTAAETNGEELFNENCSSCHSTPWFSVATPQQNFFSFDTLDFGMEEWTNNWGDRWRFKSPSLRNVAATAPYMHNGRKNSLEEVVRFYSDSINAWNNDLGLIDFSTSEVNDLVAFLHTLTSPNLLTHPKWSDPFVEPSATAHLPFDGGIRVFPNPSATTLTVQLPLGLAANYDIALITMDGKTVKSMRSSLDLVQLEIGDLLPGIYLLQVGKGGSISTQRIVVQ